MSQASLGDEFGIEVSLNRLKPAFGSKAGILDAAKGHFRQSKAQMIDRHHAAFHACRDRIRGFRRTGEGVSAVMPVGPAPQRRGNA